MKALTVRQPWASFIMAGIKALETRPTRTAYRGPLVIHAAKYDYWQLRDDLNRVSTWMPVGLGQPRHFESTVDAFDEVCRWAGLPPVACLPRGVALGTVNLSAVGRFESDGCSPSSLHVHWEPQDGYGATGLVSDFSHALGWCEAGRWAWHMTSPVLFDDPIAARGQQGLWEFSHQEDSL